LATPAEIDEQIKLERDAISQGLTKLHKNTRDLEAKSYASATVYGAASIDTLLPLVVAQIESTTARLTKGQAGAAFKEIHKYLADVEPLAAAAIAIKLTFDKVFSYKDKSHQVTNVCDAIGLAIEQECQMRHYEKNAPGLLKTLKDNYWHKSIGTQQKLVVIRTLMNRYNVKQWDAGVDLIASNLEAGYLIASCRVAAGSRRTCSKRDANVYNMLYLLQSSLKSRTQ